MSEFTSCPETHFKGRKPMITTLVLSPSLIYRWHILHICLTRLALEAKLGPFSMIACTRKSSSLAFLKNGCFSSSVAVGLQK